MTEKQVADLAASLTDLHTELALILRGRTPRLGNEPIGGTTPAAAGAALSLAQRRMEEAGIPVLVKDW